MVFHCVSFVVTDIYYWLQITPYIINSYFKKDDLKVQNSVIHEFTSSLWNTVAESDLMMPKYHLIVCNMVMPRGAHM